MSSHSVFTTTQDIAAVRSVQPSLPFYSQVEPTFQVLQSTLGAPVLGVTSAWPQSHPTQVTSFHSISGWLNSPDQDLNPALWAAQSTCCEPHRQLVLIPPRRIFLMAPTVSSHPNPFYRDSLGQEESDFSVGVWTPKRRAAGGL